MGSRFGIQVQHNFGGGLDMLDYLNGLDDSIRRTVVRKMVRAGGTILAKEIRSEIKKRDMPYARGRTAATRKSARQSGQKPLIRTIGQKAWSNPRKGIIGTVVGPQYPAGAHGHLVEKGVVTATRRTVAHHFQRDANKIASPKIRWAMALKMKDALESLHNPHIAAAIVRRMQASEAPF